MSYDVQVSISAKDGVNVSIANAVKELRAIYDKFPQVFANYPRQVYELTKIAKFIENGETLSQIRYSETELKSNFTSEFYNVTVTSKEHSYHAAFREKQEFNEKASAFLKKAIDENDTEAAMIFCKMYHDNPEMFINAAFAG